MIKSLTFSILLILSFQTAIKAQNLKSDSLRDIAIVDTKKFKLSNEAYKKFKKEGKNPFGDYFKPTLQYTKNPALLSDSAYVRAFRHSAYKHTVSKKSTGHYFILGIGIALAAVVAIIFGLFAAASK